MMKRKGFLESFFQEYPCEEWIKIIDWLFWDEKFILWTKLQLKQFVEDYKATSMVRDGLYLYDKKAVSNPSKYNRQKNRKKKSIIIMVRGQGQARDIVRHIRNAVVHGGATLCTRNGIRHLEIIDYGNYGENNSRNGQTAYMLIPVDFVKKLFDTYNSIQNSI